MKGLVKLSLFFLIMPAGRAEIIDRIAVVVGTSVITESEILREVRLTAFLNGTPVDFSAATKRKTAERLVEQRLVANEISASLYPQPTQAASEEMLKQIKGRFSSPGSFQEELARVGVTEDDLKAHLTRQLATLSFLDFRFRRGIQIGEEQISKYFEERLKPELSRARPGQKVLLNDYRLQAQELLIGEGVNQASDVWLKEVRSRTRIEFRPDSFEPERPKQEASK